ncbi:hypothetical protein PMAYCL1PPCAC_15283 [Pristionchus mayeri]|uniref:CRAL-TRIO domain-containing protein n=1 Tax=Pristionchus mayeri TaxID=1317129 RepID=A0AAN5HXT0_9BILA|nr:hypothetical protein PMAYCL1PPCAC_15283 [Pristionchus mayeri]
MPSEKERVAELRSLVSPYLTSYYDTHFNLLRWIQAYPGASIDQVANRLRQHLLFRASDWKLDSMVEKERGYHPLHSFWPLHEVGMSGVIPNTIVVVEQSGYVDHLGIHENFSHTEIFKAKLHDVEAMLAAVMKVEKETGEQASVMMVVDCEGFAYTKKLVDFMMGPMMSRGEFLLQHYAELVSHIIFVNFPSWATVAWKMITPLLPERTREKFRILSSNWRDEITSLMDPSIGPSFWNDEKHKEFKTTMARPPKVPRLEIKSPSEKLDKLHVKAGKEHWIEYYLEKGDAVDFHIMGNSSFGFSIVRVDGEEENDVFAMRPVFPLFASLHGPLKVPIEDRVVVPESGLYKMWFSNLRAWFSSVAIHHSIKVHKNQITV